eukprot:TRINITY_DN42390_c0_g1_i1.p1 TRINITY_DN42390_c0_g1~~TRINITY_DN42390_c0_g1_i1.p1  ORF type:complete len:377 (+),score=55.92 TRINITY_DN42390_c0_g1_i1:33-1133(+)
MEPSCVFDSPEIAASVVKHLQSPSRGLIDARISGVNSTFRGAISEARRQRGARFANLAIPELQVGGLKCLALSEDSSMIFVGGQKGLVCLDSKTMQVRHRMTSDPIGSVAVQGDSVYTGKAHAPFGVNNGERMDENVTQRRISTGEIVRQIETMNQVQEHLCIQNGFLWAGGSDDYGGLPGAIEQIDLHSGETVTTVEGHPDEVDMCYFYQCAHVAQGDFIFWCPVQNDKRPSSRGVKQHRISAPSEEPVRSLCVDLPQGAPQADFSTSAMAAHPDGYLLCAGCHTIANACGYHTLPEQYAAVLKQWHVDRGVCVSTMNLGTGGRVCAMALLPNEELLIILREGQDGGLQVYDLMFDNHCVWSCPV